MLSPSLVTFLFLVAPVWAQVPLMEDNTAILNVEGRQDVNARFWMDSYSVGNRCYCETTYDHNIGTVMVDTPLGTLSVRAVCEILGPGPGSTDRPIYNDIQCGNGPPNDAGDEDTCPGRTDHGPEGCGYIGPVWNFSDLVGEAPQVRPPPPSEGSTGAPITPATTTGEPTDPPTPVPSGQVASTEAPTSAPISVTVEAGTSAPVAQQTFMAFPELTLAPIAGASSAAAAPTTSSAQPISSMPSSAPSISNAPSLSMIPSSAPSVQPSSAPSISHAPSVSMAPSSLPSDQPSQFPTLSTMPSATPSISHAPSDSMSPSSAPSNIPSLYPTISMLPSTTPSNIPSMYPTISMLPSTAPSYLPTLYPSVSTAPSRLTTQQPLASPTLTPAVIASTQTSLPTQHPLASPSLMPAAIASVQSAPPLVELPGSSQANGAVVTGELRKWHKITLAFQGPNTNEGATPNPFTDFRLDVTFSTGDLQMTVPGFYAADGDAANTSADSGSIWHCHFSPPATGTWKWQASFLSGSDVALQWPGQVSGNAISFSGQTGSFNVEGTNKSGRDLRGRGALKYVEGKHHLQFTETGEWFLKAGSDSPENFFAYDDFDNTPNSGNWRKSWQPHEQDFNSGDPTWSDGKGTGIIGALNYLAAQGMQAFSFLTMNINGDDKNVYPYVSESDRTRIDISKTAQWEIVLEHADRMGLFLHFKTQELENSFLLDGGDLGRERRLYYRELVARFGHHLALNWNLGEETQNSAEQVKSFSDFFKLIDPYQHPVVVHTGVNSNFYSGLLGHPTFDGPSLQTRTGDVFKNTLKWVQESNGSGHTWIVANDEQAPAGDGVVPDSVDTNHDVIRKDVLYGNIMAGGAGVEYYFGYSHDNSDLSCQDFRSRENMWKQSRYALEFFSNNNVPFQDMSNDDSRVSSGNWCLVEQSTGKSIVVYLRNGGMTDIDLTGLGAYPGANDANYSVRWYDPRSGGELQIGSVDTLEVGPPQSLGSAPKYSDFDWIVLLECIAGC